MVIAVYCGCKTTTKTCLTRGAVNPYHSDEFIFSLKDFMVNIFTFTVIQ